MAKNVKSKGQASRRPITEYFTRKRPQSNAVISDSPTQGSPHSPSTTENQSWEPPSTSSQASNKRKATSSLDPDVESESSLRPTRSTSTRPSNANAAPPTPLSPRENLLHHSDSSRFSSCKKQRLSSPDLVDIDEIVPGSESDEVEIPARRVSSALVTVSDRLAEMEQECDDRDLVPMDIDDHSPLFTPNSTSYSLFGTDPDTSFGSPFLHPLTPPSSSPEPEKKISALDSEAKTRQLIEEIRTKARAKVMSSPEPMGLRSLSASDEDEDLPDLPALSRSSKGKEKEISDPSKSDTAGPSKYNLRQPTKRPSPKEVLPLMELKRSKPNPLLALLKEKNKADRAGKGAGALTRAERAVMGKRELRDEVDGEDDADDEMEDWMGDETKAWQAVQERVNSYGSDDDNGGLGVDLDFDANDAKRLFSEDTERGEAVAAILASEKRNREHDHRSMKRVGHPLWIVEPEDAMDVDTCYDFEGGNTLPALRSFKAALQEHNLTLACLLLRNGAMNKLDFSANTQIVACLCELALTSRHTDLNQAAFHLLRNSWNDVSPSGPCLPFHSMVNVLARLGANVAAFGWTSGVSLVQVTKEERENILARFVQLCAVAGSSEKIQPSDVPEVLISLSAISLDPTTSPELRIDIFLAAHTICSSLAVDAAITIDLEAKICSRLLQFISTLTPINRAHVVSIFAAGGGRTLRIARWVAHHLIIDKAVVSEREYCDLPPLEPLLPRLAPFGHTADFFKIHPETDYDNVGFYAEIMSAALTNIAGYAAEEQLASVAAKNHLLNSESSPRKIEKADPPVKLVRNCVELIHSNISDTKGSHLDRSRAKAILKNLSMRLYYQRDAALKANGSKPKNIKQYFSKKT